MLTQFHKNKGSFIRRFSANPARVIVSSFALLIFVGTLLLMLPISSASGRFTSLLDALFTATSATCVTGLTVQNTGVYFSGFGQGVILALIQCGGLGLITFATFFNLAIRKKAGFKSIQVARESVSSDATTDIRRLMSMILIITLLFELTGACVLMIAFVPEYGVQGIFHSLFLAVSSYCNAGFDLLGGVGAQSSLCPLYDNPLVLITISVLIISGGLGFIVWQDIYHVKVRKRLTLHTKVVLIGTAGLLVLGTVFIALLEWGNPGTLGSMNPDEKVLNSFFLSVSSRTAGFNTFPLENMTGLTKLTVIALMFIGAAPGSTGGGIKVTTMFVLIATVVCVLTGKNDTVINHRKVDKGVVYKSLAITVAALVAVMICTGVVIFTVNPEAFSEINALFESVSAFGTVGLTIGVTEYASAFGRIALILAMFLGRVGPMSLALSLAMRPIQKSTVLPEGKIMVG